MEHHLAHLASAFLVSPFEEAVAVSVDGFGDFASAAWGVGRGSAVEVEDRVYFPHSLGIFYQALTQYLGFPHYGDEYKVMGLAPYGEPAFLPQMRKIVRAARAAAASSSISRTSASHGEGGLRVGGRRARGRDALFAGARASCSGPRAAGGRAARRSGTGTSRARCRRCTRRRSSTCSRTCTGATSSMRSCLAGGCAMNSVANGKVYARTPFRRLYVQAAAGDAGGAIGAALVAWQRVRDGAGAARSPMDARLLGAGVFAMREIGAAIDARKAEIDAQRMLGDAHCRRRSS